MSLQTQGDAPLRPGEALIDAPLHGVNGDTWLVSEAQGKFILLGFADTQLPAIDGINRIGINSHADYPCFEAVDGHALRRYGRDTIYLLRPDGHVCAVFNSPDITAITAAYQQAKGA